MANLSSPPAAGASSISPPLLIQLLVRLAVALAAVAAAALGTWLLWDLLEPTITPLFLIAIAISGWVGGLRGGILAAGLSAIASIALCAQLEWRGQLGWASAIWGSSFLLVALLTGALNAARRRAEKLLIERDLRMRLISDQIPAGLWSTDRQL
ncbi:MAG TPA: hypothetical protein VNL70_09020, partial [Tepidisphaeraceae bacterium]|nr:hypothetical protein [Tepidisphaeraceae bacterium]